MAKKRPAARQLTKADVTSSDNQDASKVGKNKIAKVEPPAAAPSTRMKLSRSPAQTRRSPNAVRSIEKDDRFSDEAASVISTASSVSTTFVNTPASTKPQACTPSKPKKAVLSKRPTKLLKVYVFGSNAVEQLGYPSPTRATLLTQGVDVVKTPQLNHDLSEFGVVQIAAGSAHGLALTRDGKILSWGCPDLGALGRNSISMENKKDAQSRGQLQNVAIGEVSETWPAHTVITQVVASQAAGFALTERGDVWGWGSFRNNEGAIGLVASNPIPAFEPVQLTSLVKIARLASAPNANHLLALSSTGSVFAIGAGEQNQLGRRLLERSKQNALKSTKVSFTLTHHGKGTPGNTPKKAAYVTITDIAVSDEASFAIDTEGRVWSWGRNDFYQLGHGLESGGHWENLGATPNADEGVAPVLCSALSGQGRVTCVGGGRDFSHATNEKGNLLVWGRADGGNLGLDEKKLDAAAKKKDLRVIGVATGSNHVGQVASRILTIASKALCPGLGKVMDMSISSTGSVVVNDKGRVFAWGDGQGYGLGTGNEEYQDIPREITDAKDREAQKFVRAALGLGWGMMASLAS